MLKLTQRAAGAGAENAIGCAGIKALFIELCLQCHNLIATHTRCIRRRRLQKSSGTGNAICQMTYSKRVKLRAVPAHDDIKVVVYQKGWAAMPSGYQQRCL